MQVSMVSERRRYPRATVDSLVPVDLGRDNGGIVLNLSEGGLRIRAIGPLEADQLVKLGFSLLGKDNRIETFGQIAWVDESGTGGAVCFLDLAESARRQIRQWMPRNVSAADIEQEPTATLRPAAMETESRESSPAPGKATRRVPSPAETDATAEGKPQVPSAFVYTGADPFGSTPSEDYRATESQAILSPPGASPEPWLRDEWKAKTPTRRPKLGRQLIQGIIGGCLVVLTLIGGLVLYRSQRERMGELLGDIKRTIIGEPWPSETGLPPPATISPAKPKPRSSRRGGSKGWPTEEGSASSPGAGGMRGVAGAPSKQSGTSQLEVLESNNQRRLIDQRGGPIVRLRTWPSVARVQFQTEDFTTTPVPESATAATAPAQSVERRQGISGGIPERQQVPEYPPLALQYNVQGTVVLRAVIGKDGTVQNVQLLSGPPILAWAVLDAVLRWRYMPYLRNGEPVEVETQITVDFSITTK